MANETLDTSVSKALDLGLAVAVIVGLYKVLPAVITAIAAAI